jgi:glycosyltransferase involved in cell wall biosynthesis
MWLSFARAAYVLPWSSWARSSLVQDYGVDPRNIEIIPPGVDLDFWRPYEDERPPGPIRILFVGGDFERKGGNLLIDAFHALPPGAAELVLVTRSAVPPRPGITTYRELRPNTPELLALYHSCDLFVLPSCAEAFGIAAVEASAAGLPVIATAVGGLADVVADRESGFLIENGQVEALIYRLQLLIDSPGLRQKLGQAARKRAEQCFDARQNAARILEHLFELAMQERRNESFS